jgi:hypothetical protein
VRANAPKIAILAAMTSVSLTSCSEDPSFVETTSTGEPVLARSAEDAESSTLDSTASSIDDEAIARSAASNGEEAVHSSTQNVEKDQDSNTVAVEETKIPRGDMGDNEPNDKNTDSEKDGTNTSVRLEPVTLNYTQNAGNKVDILWVIDTSGSMEEEQDYLGDNFNGFIRGMANSGLDFQTAVTSTDICPSHSPSDLSQVVCPNETDKDDSVHLRGSFVGRTGRKVLKHDDSDLVRKFNAYTALGINGSQFEHGLKAADMAVEKVLSGENEDLIRSDAFLAIIVVSDEEDDGIGLGMKDAYTEKNFVSLGLTTFKFTHTDLIDHLKIVKGVGKFAISAITGTRKSNGKLCTSEHSNPKEEGTQYINAAKDSGGIVQSICDTDWEASLSKMGADLSSQISQIALERAPAADSIKVYVDGVITDKWTYETGSKIIKFAADGIPPGGAAIRVEYMAPAAS